VKSNWWTMVSIFLENITIRCNYIPQYWQEHLLNLLYVILKGDVVVKRGSLKDVGPSKV
jgi:hypothetical protein